MNYKFPFENLKVWSISKDLAVEVYSLCKKFEKSEVYGLRTQMQTSAVSISSNIAEGNSRRNVKDRIRFFNIAYSSLMELISQTLIACELGLIDINQTTELRKRGIEIASMLISLINNQVEIKKDK